MTRKPTWKEKVLKQKSLQREKGVKGMEKKKPKKAMEMGVLFSAIQLQR